MLELGHLGIGLRLTRIVRPFAPAIPVLIGSALPDLLDKPLYYAAATFTGRTSTDIGLISCTRTFGHTALFLFLFLLPALLLRAPRIRIIFSALAFGIFTHHLLDIFQDAFISSKPFSEGAGIQAFLFPLYKSQFASMPTKNAGEHLFLSLSTPALLAGEVLGMILLYSDWKKWRRKRAPLSNP